MTKTNMRRGGEYLIYTSWFPSTLRELVLRFGIEMKQKPQNMLLTVLTLSRWHSACSHNSCPGRQHPQRAGPLTGIYRHENAPQRQLCSQAKVMVAVPQLRLPQVTLACAKLTAEHNQEASLGVSLVQTLLSARLPPLPILQGNK